MKNTTVTTVTTNTAIGVIPITYSLDLSHYLKIKGLVFKDTCTLLTVDQELYLKLTALEQVSVLKESLTSLDSLVSKGYLNSQDLSTYPFVSEFLPSFFMKDYASEMLQFVNGDKSMETYKWLYNLIILTLYYLNCSSLRQWSDNKSIDTDLFTDLRVQERVLFSRLDASIRHHMRKRGLSLTQNTYMGFDTEFNNVSMTNNTLVSAQLAITSGICIKVPNTPRYTISHLDVEKNKLHRTKTKSEIFNYSKVESSIQWLVQQISRLKHGNYDESMVIICEGLKTVKGMSYYESEEHTLFKLPRSEIQPYIVVKDNITLEELLQTASTISTPTLESMAKIVIKLVMDICSRNLSLQNGKDNLLEQLFLFYSDYPKRNDLAMVSENQLPIITQIGTQIGTPQQPEGTMKKRSKRAKIALEKKRSRDTIPDLFQEGQGVSVTTTKKYTLIAHLTSADLSMLSDFDLIKEELNIVNGSFVTLRDPLNYDGKIIHIRF
jgi:hypothetical protein